MRRLIICLWWLFPATSLVQAADPFQVLPPELRLEGDFAQAQLLVTAADDQGEFSSRSADLSGSAQYASSDSSVVVVESGGRVRAMANGQAQITVSAGGHERQVQVTVAGVGSTPVDFTRDIRPILNKAGCASAACHAAQHGKGGFKLSVFGFDPPADYEAVARAGRQRRLNFASPDRSLFLRKPAMGMPHGGGLRLPPDGLEYQVLRSWIASGAPAPRADAPEVTHLTVAPASRVTQVGQSQQLQVIAHYSDQSQRDVTAQARFDSMDDGVLSVDGAGLVRCEGRGQAAIMVRYEDQAEIATFVIPYAESVQLAGWRNQNYVDELAEAKFRELGLEPSPLCDDATFVRRAFLDAIGTLPTPEVTTAFVQSADPDKRTRLIDQLLGLTGDPQLDIYNDQYAAYWTLKWSDLIRNNSNSLGEQGMWALHNWIREALRTNRPYDEFVRELVMAKGSIYSNGPANYFRIHTDSSALTEATAQIFLGVRLECAKCHHHPFEKYSQADYYSLAAYFARVGTKNSEEFGLFGRESVVTVRSTGDVRHPRTGQLMQPKPLEAEPIDDPLDRRIPLAAWLTAPDNRLFARAVVNRYMGYLLGRGLVEPLDDMRSTNPPSNVALLETLAEDFVDHRFDLKHLIRTIMTSRLYQLDSQPTPENASDRRFYSHYRVKRLTAEPLLDAIDQVTGVQTKFRNLPLGTRAIELPDAEYPDYFLNTFAKPKRASVCECERTPDENLAQALHTLNGDTIAQKISDKNGRLARLLAENRPHDEIVRELYLSALCRWPSEEELVLSRQFLQESPSPKECYEDLLWALINSKQFLFAR
ncbi:MAG: DUF1553 domain-containing protein [Pirellulaceae bacterium]|nr:DUF1553 domain-containing protein [Pirellulaceae bacterium]